MDTTLEDLVHWTISLIAGSLDLNLDDVSHPGATIEIRVTLVDRHTVDEALDMAQLTVDEGQLARRLVHSPEFNCVVVPSHEPVANCVEELDVLALLLQLIGSWTVGLGATFTHVPQDELVDIADASK